MDASCEIEHKGNPEEKVMLPDEFFIITFAVLQAEWNQWQHHREKGGTCPLFFAKIKYLICQNLMRNVWIGVSSI